MFNFISLVIGVLGLSWVTIAFIPLLGWANWVIMPLTIIGLGIGTLSDKQTGRNLNIVVMCIGIVRLALGGGVF